MRRSLKVAIPAVVAAAAISAVAVSQCSSPTRTAAAACLAAPRPQYVIAPPNQTRYAPDQGLVLADHTTLDARGVTFDDSTLNGAGFGVGIKLYAETGSRDNLCLVGGSITSSQDTAAVPWTTWHQEAGLTVLTSNFTDVGTHFYNQGDAITFPSLGSTNWSVIGAAASGPPGSAGAFIHDDCIENDFMNTGLVDDSLFDGCSDFLSSAGGTNGGQNLVEVRNTLVRLQSMHNSYNPAKYGFDQHGGFFKFSSPPLGGIPPQLYVHDSTFRADSPAAFAGNANGWLALPPGTRCDHVTLIGTAAWPARDLASWTSQCTNVTLGTTGDWDSAVAAWTAAHPDVATG